MILSFHSHVACIRHFLEPAQAQQLMKGLVHNVLIPISALYRVELVQLGKEHVVEY